MADYVPEAAPDSTVGVVSQKRRERPGQGKNKECLEKVSISCEVASAAIKRAGDRQDANALYQTVYES